MRLEGSQTSPRSPETPGGYVGQAALSLDKVYPVAAGGSRELPSVFP